VVLDALPVVKNGIVAAGNTTAVAAKKTGSFAVAAVMVAGRAVGSTAKNLTARKPAPDSPPAIQPPYLPAQPAPAQQPQPLYAAPAQPQIVYAAPPPQQIHIHNVVNQSTVVNGSNQRRKSVLVAFLLAFFFGPIGMLYSTVFGAFVMFFLNMVVAVLTFGTGLLITWPIGCIWAASAASRS
jgi:hypothetical protein